MTTYAEIGWSLLAAVRSSQLPAKRTVAGLLWRSSRRSGTTADDCAHEAAIYESVTSPFSRVYP